MITTDARVLVATATTVAPLVVGAVGHNDSNCANCGSCSQK